MAFDILTRVKDYLSISSGDTTKDTFLTQLINNVQSEIEDYCYQPIEQVGVNIPIRQMIHSNDDLQLDYFNVPIDVLTITYKFPFDATIYVVDAADYEQLLWWGIPVIKFKNGLNSNASYTIAAAVGYPTASVPNIILEVATEMVAFKYQESYVGGGLLGKASSAISHLEGGGGTDSYKDLSSRWQRYLDKYKLKIF